MRCLIYITILINLCFIKAQESTFEQAAEASSFLDAFPTLFRLKRSLIQNSDESTAADTNQRFRPPVSKQFEQYVFQLILQSHNLNLGNLRDIYVEANGDAKTIVAKLNEAFGNEILYIDEEHFLRINSHEYFLFFNGYISQISKDTPYLDTLLNNVLKPYISKLQVNVDEFRVPIDTILERVEPHLKRNRRYLIPYEDDDEEEKEPPTEVIRSFLHIIVEWIRSAAKSVVTLVVLQLNNASYGLFLPAFELLQTLLLGVIDAIIISI